MPEALIRKMKAGYRGSGLSDEEINHRVYGHLNKTGQLEEADSRKSKLVKKIRRKQRVEKYLRRSY